MRVSGQVTVHNCVGQRQRVHVLKWRVSDNAKGWAEAPLHLVEPEELRVLEMLAHHDSWHEEGIQQEVGEANKQCYEQEVL